jgi:hypothetical protein
MKKVKLRITMILIAVVALGAMNLSAEDLRERTERWAKPGQNRAAPTVTAEDATPDPTIGHDTPAGDALPLLIMLAGGYIAYSMRRQKEKE